MAKWTKKAALERMKNNQELEQVYIQYPHTRLLVESAAKLKRYPSYHRISCYYAYKDWMRAVILDENKAYWTCVSVIDDLLPPDDADLNKEDGSAISTYNPALPGLPPRPERKAEFRLYSIQEVAEKLAPKEKQRHLEMRKTLEKLEKGNTMVEPHFILPEADARVQATAYAHGLDAIALMLFKQLPPGASLPPALVTNMPQEQADIADLAHGAGEILLLQMDGAPTTNDPTAFLASYVKGYTQGYRFSQYALAHGLLDVLYHLSPDRRYELLFLFAWNLLMPKEEQEHKNDLLASQELKQLQAIYKQYQALN
jgi:hypothetical protein